MQADCDGRMVAPDYHDRLYGNGALGANAASWIRDMCASTTADHVFIWLHHPPAGPVGLTNDADYKTEWAALLPALAQFRWFGAGHTHVPDQYQFQGRPVFVSPALKNNFDLQAATMLPTG